MGVCVIYASVKSKQPEAARRKQLFLAALVTELKSLEGDAEGRYRALMQALEAEPQMAEDPDFAHMRRDIVCGRGASLFLKAKRLLDTGLAAASIEYFTRAHVVLTAQIDVFALDQEIVLALARKLTLEMAAIGGPANLPVAYLRLEEIRNMAQSAKLDESSRHAFMLICQSAVYREIAPYLANGDRPSPAA